ncbi:MAG TPA: GlxA family transcriptional regulator [Sphingomonadales bacterium]|nr:GlxA family transcriptional regulator [Sphingomonadales bacterium]
MKKIAFLLFDQFQILDVTGPAQVFSCVNEIREQPAYDIHYLSTEGSLCRATCGMAMMTEKIYDLAGYDSLIISGGRGTRAACADRALIAFIKAQSARVRRIISICTGTFLLSEAGLVDGKRVTTHWAYADRLKKQNARLQVIPDALYIRQGKVITSAGVTAGMDLALSLIEEDFGAEMAKEVARQMVIFYRRPGGQSQFSSFQMADMPEDDPLGQLCLHIAAHPKGDYRLSQLAHRMNMTERTFLRHFQRNIGQSPAKFIEKARLDHARRALEETSQNLDQIAHAAGFHSPEVLRRTFHRHLSISPKEYRERFGGRIVPTPPTQGPG